MYRYWGLVISSELPKEPCPPQLILINRVFSARCCLSVCLLRVQPLPVQGPAGRLARRSRGLGRARRLIQAGVWWGLDGAFSVLGHPCPERTAHPPSPTPAPPVLGSPGRPRSGPHCTAPGALLRAAASDPRRSPGGPLPRAPPLSPSPPTRWRQHPPRGALSVFSAGTVADRVLGSPTWWPFSLRSRPWPPCRHPRPPVATGPHTPASSPNHRV